MTMVELFLYLMGVVGAIAGVQGAWSHGFLWSLLALPLGLLIGIFVTMPLIAMVGLIAVSLIPLEKYLEKQTRFPFPIFYQGLETLSGILLLVILILAPIGLFGLVFSLVDHGLKWLGQ